MTMRRLERGYIQIYTGDGKGKTTAALGLALRGAGGGLHTFIVQFMKDFPYGEIKGTSLLREWITLEQFGNDAFVLRKQPPGDKDLEAAAAGLRRAEEEMMSGRCDIVVLDEICVAIHFGLLGTEAVISLMEKKPENVELVLTGRHCPQQLSDKADLVTEMLEIKHYYRKGVLARKGIES